MCEIVINGSSNEKCKRIEDSFWRSMINFSFKKYHQDSLDIFCNRRNHGNILSKKEIFSEFATGEFSEDDIEKLERVNFLINPTKVYYIKSSVENLMSKIGVKSEDPNPERLIRKVNLSLMSSSEIYHYYYLRLVVHRKVPKREVMLKLHLKSIFGAALKLVCKAIQFFIYKSYYSSKRYIDYRVAPFFRELKKTRLATSEESLYLSHLGILESLNSGENSIEQQITAYEDDKATGYKELFSNYFILKILNGRASLFYNFLNTCTRITKISDYINKSDVKASNILDSLTYELCGEVLLNTVRSSRGFSDKDLFLIYPIALEIMKVSEENEIEGKVNSLNREVIYSLVDHKEFIRDFRGFKVWANRFGGKEYAHLFSFSMSSLYGWVQVLADISKDSQLVRAKYLLADLEAKIDMGCPPHRLILANNLSRDALEAGFGKGVRHH